MLLKMNAIDNITIAQRDCLHLMVVPDTIKLLIDGFVGQKVAIDTNR